MYNPFTLLGLRWSQKFGVHFSGVLAEKEASGRICSYESPECEGRWEVVLDARLARCRQINIEGWGGEEVNCNLHSPTGPVGLLVDSGEEKLKIVVETIPFVL